MHAGSRLRLTPEIHLHIHTERLVEKNSKAFVPVTVSQQFSRKRGNDTRSSFYSSSETWTALEQPDCRTCVGL